MCSFTGIWRRIVRRSTHTVRTCLMLAACTFAYAADTQPVESQAAHTAVMIEIRDAIGPATSDFFVRALKKAEATGAPLLLVQLDTPGGLDSAMRDMIRAMIASRVPVVIYVAPSGARAASAGTYLLYASHVAAMAPATNLGAATPVQIGGSPNQPESEGKASQSASDRKAVNDSIAYIRGLAELRGRNADWAEDAVRNAASVSASAALESKVIDVIATDVPDLLRQIDGRRVKVADGEVTLQTSKLLLERVELDWRTRLLSVLTNPNVAYLLMLMGVYGLLLEGYNPGAVLPGVVGGICLLLALYAFQVLSVNYAGLALMALGVALIVAEAFAPSFGALGLGGIAAFVFGSIILMDAEVPGFQVARSLIAGVSTAAGVLMLLLVTYFARARRRPVITGVELLQTQEAVALADFDRTGQVRVGGEIWNAESPTAVRAGQKLRIVAVRGLTLQVAPDGSNEPAQ